MNRTSSPDRIDVDRRENDYDRCLALNQQVATRMGFAYQPVFASGNVMRVHAGEQRQQAN